MPTLAQREAAAARVRQSQAQEENARQGLLPGLPPSYTRLGGNQYFGNPVL